MWRAVQYASRGISWAQLEALTGVSAAFLQLEGAERQWWTATPIPVYNPYDWVFECSKVLPPEAARTYDWGVDSDGHSFLFRGDAETCPD